MKRALIITSIAIAALAVFGGVIYTYGTPQSPDVAVQAASGPAPAYGSVPVAMPPSRDELAASEQPVAPSAERPADGQAVPEPDPSVPLAIEIPGCKCHSDDPKIVEEHSAYRMNQCAGCHGGQTPTGQ
jgi:hypothetical protein